MEYQKNLEVLERCRPALYQKIVKLDGNSLDKKNQAIETIEAKNGSTISVIERNGKKVRLNSSYNPQHEAEVWASQFSFRNMNNHIAMYGLGNGYFAKELLLHMLENDYLFVYEPSAEVFINTLHNFDLREILEEPRICIGVEDINAYDFHKALLAICNMESIQNLKIATHPGYKTLYVSEFEYFKQEVKFAAEEARMNYNTLLVLAESSIKNQFLNMSKLKDSISITQLRNIWNKEVPAIIVAAGPSLADSLEPLRRVKGKALIVAVDRIVQYLRDHGIEPDIVANIDPNKNVANFSTGQQVEAPMFCLIQSQPKIMDRHSGRKVVCWCGSYLYEEYEKALGEYPEVNLSGSVATVAVEILGYLGTKKICLVGQDLAYSGEQTHVGGTVSNPCGIGNELIEGIKGDKVRSRYDWINFKNWFEDFIIEHPEVEIIDTKKSGALIKGSKHMELEDAIGDVPVSSDSIIKSINCLPAALGEEQFQNIKHQLSVDLNEMDKMKRKAKEGARYCTDLINLVKQGKTSSKGLDSKVAKVKGITEFLNETNLYKNIDQLVSAYMNHDLVKVYTSKEEESENLINVYDSSRSLFEAIERALKFVEPFMKEALIKLEEES